MTTSPRRRSPGRGLAVVVVLVVAATVPAAALAVAWWWASDHAASPPTTTTTIVSVGSTAPRLTTELVSLRRVPGPIADQVTEAAERALFEPLMSAIGPTSCASVSISGEMIATANENVQVVPASTQKLVIAAVALDVLGPEHRFRTEVRGGPLVDGVLTGDLHLIGGGDPLLQSADVVDDLRFPAFNTTSFDALADQLVDAGLRVVDGDVVGDGSRYDDEFVVPSWGDTITRRDAGPYDALLVNDGRLFGSGYGLNPNQSAASELNRLLAARGVTVTGRNRSGVVADGAGLLAAVESVPLGGVIEELLQTSDNNTAEMLLKEIGAAVADDGSRSAGAAVVRERLAGWGVPADLLVLDDGSGLSRENRLTCAALVALMEDAPVADLVSDALAVAGRSGTLADQFLGSPVEGLLRAKTGTLTGVKALSGQVPTSDGGIATFSIVLNEEGADDPAVHLPLWDELVEALESYPVVVDVEEFAPR